MSRKRQLRILETAEEYSNLLIQVNEGDKILSKQNDELFVVDRVGSERSRRKLTSKLIEIERNATEIVLSAADKKIIDKRNDRNSKKTVVTESKTNDIVDLWSDPAAESIMKPNKELKDNTTKVPKKKSCILPINGQSYNPNHEDHQDALAEALAIEIRKKEHEARTKGPIEYTLSELTKSVLCDDVDSDDDGDDEGNDVFLMVCFARFLLL